MSLAKLATQVAHQLACKKVRLVLAESCTAGLVSATLAQSPGISAWHCGSAVTYREATKVAWLGVDPVTIEEQTAVSELVAQQMANGVLRQTPEADLAGSITGHLGPNAPDASDGLVFIAIAWRRESEEPETTVVQFRLTSQDRLARQQEAAELVFKQLLVALTAAP